MPGLQREQPGRKQRWGIYTLAFLILAFAMVVVSSTQGHYTVLTLLGLVVGFIGAGVCTVKGLRLIDFRHLEEIVRGRR